MKKTFALSAALMCLTSVISGGNVLTTPDISYAEEIIHSGKVSGCSESDLTYTLDSEGTLTISGEGAMPCHAGFGWDEIKKVVIEDGVTCIDTEDFYLCENLETVVLPEKGCYINYFAFSGCGKLKEIYIPDSITGGFSNKAFGRPDKSFTVVGYDNTYAEMYAEATGCSFRSLGEAERRSIYTGALGEDIKYDVYNTLDIVISGSGKMHDYNYETSPFGYSAVKNITIEDGVTSIADGMFTVCSQMRQITLPDSLTSIGAGAFYECTGLADITIPKNVTSIGEDAFLRCSDTFTIKGYKGSCAETYANKNKINFEALPEPVKAYGDINSDGILDVRDIIVFQKWFTGTLEPAEEQKDTMDINEDGKLNIVDFCLIKEKVLSGF